MRRVNVILAIALCLLFTNCTDKATNSKYSDQAAIIDLISIDYEDLFMYELIDTPIPDTTSFYNGSTDDRFCYWKIIGSNTRNIKIDIQYPELKYPIADVSILDSIEVITNVIYYDTTATPDSIIRLTNSTYELQNIKAVLKQINPSSKNRNGWWIESITGNNGYAFPPYRSLNSVIVTASLSQQRIFSIDDILTPQPTSELLSVGKGENRKITIIKGGYDDDIVTFHMSEINGCRKIDLEKLDENTYQAIFTAPERNGFFYITADVINVNDLIQSDEYHIHRWAIPVYVVD
ncbi:MAG: hypothetical protein GY855_12490 [candidate division Zixibacteria bacterium]|nr:hypothetical protein [candidate division Zixibacteria bacterium]